MSRFLIRDLVWQTMKEREWIFGDGHYPYNPSPFADCIDARFIPPWEVPFSYRERISI